MMKVPKAAFVAPAPCLHVTTSVVLNKAALVCLDFVVTTLVLFVHIINILQTTCLWRLLMRHVYVC